MTTDTANESFCERCGTAVSARPPRTRRGRGRLLGRLRSETDPFRIDFEAAVTFCIECRQYVCPQCWNEAEGRCRTCAPNPEDMGVDANATAPSADLGIDGGRAAEPTDSACGADGAHERPHDEEPWPVVDLPAEVASPVPVAPMSDAVGDQAWEPEVRHAEAVEADTADAVVEPEAVEAEAVVTGEELTAEEPVEPEAVEAEAVVTREELTAPATEAVEAAIQPATEATDTVEALAAPPAGATGAPGTPDATGSTGAPDARSLARPRRRGPRSPLTHSRRARSVAARHKGGVPPAATVELAAMPESQPAPAPAPTMPEPPQPASEPAPAEPESVTELDGWRLVASDSTASRQQAIIAWPSIPPGRRTVAPRPPAHAKPAPSEPPALLLPPAWKRPMPGIHAPASLAPGQSLAPPPSRPAYATRTSAAAPAGRASQVRACIGCGLPLSVNARFCRRCGGAQG